MSVCTPQQYVVILDQLCWETLLRPLLLLRLQELVAACVEREVLSWAYEM